MKERKTGNTDRKLEELLRKAQSAEPADDFEREAAEGFKGLSGEQEAFDLKERLDRRIAPLFKDRKSHKNQWLAAAGVLLVVALTVFFLRDELTSNKTVVQGSAPPAKESASFRHQETAPAENTGEGETKSGTGISDLSENNAISKKKAEKKDSRYRESAMKQTSDEAELTNSVAHAEADKDKAEPAVTTDIPVEVANRLAAPPPAAKTESFEKKSAAANYTRGKMPAASHAVASAPESVITTDSLAYFIVKELRLKLQPELQKEFGAILYFGSQGTIEKVRFTDDRKLSRKERSALEKIIKDLEIKERKVFNSHTALQFTP